MEIKRKLNKLNGWQRIGIVLSFLWFFIAGISARSYDVQKAYEFANNSSNICYQMKRDSVNPEENCSQKFSDNYKLMLEGSWESSFFIATFPIPIFWGIAIFFLKIYRWVKKGFVK